MGKRKPPEIEKFPAVREIVLADVGKNWCIHCPCGKDYYVTKWAFQGTKFSYCKRCGRKHSYAKLVKGEPA